MTSCCGSHCARITSPAAKARRATIFPITTRNSQLCRGALLSSGETTSKEAGSYMAAAQLPVLLSCARRHPVKFQRYPAKAIRTVRRAKEAHCTAAIRSIIGAGNEASWNRYTKGLSDPEHADAIIVFADALTNVQAPRVTALAAPRMEASGVRKSWLIDASSVFRT